MSYECVIGLEVHAQLLTDSKLFCACSTDFGATPNSRVCPVCLGLPGALPVLNREAVSMAMRAALALGCSIQHRSQFARKNYFYPDLPKGYQISQFDQPLATEGRLEISVLGETKRIRVQRVHMEEDAGKNVHGVGGDSLVDLNRAGVPLIEIVSHPDLRSSAEAEAYLRALRDILVFTKVNDGNLEEGSFRCDANVSIRERGAEKLGTRCELKNINSFRFVRRAIDAEVARQIALVEAGGSVVQETRAFDPDTGLTRVLRSKEEAHDYRYFPDPDLPPLVVDPAWIERELERAVELPEALRRRFEKELGLSPAAAQTLTQHPDYVRFFETALARFPEPVKLANWILNEVLRGVKVHGLSARFSVTPAQVAELLALVDEGVISGKQAKEVHQALEGTERSAREVVEERGLFVVTDEKALGATCRAVVDEHPEQVAQYRAGKKNTLGFFVGLVMKRTGGAADPKLASQLLKALLEPPG